MMLPDLKYPKKRTKIICTIGPSTWDQEVMRKCIENGMNIARVNGAFADPAELDRVREIVRNVNDDVGLMIDIKGPEVRLNKFPGTLRVKKGDSVIIGNTDDTPLYTANYKGLYKCVKPGQRMVIGDGNVELTLDKVEGDKMIATVDFGEEIKPGKALNLPKCEYSSNVLTDRDKELLKHCIKTGWDSVSASFIQSAESAKQVREFIDKHNDLLPDKEECFKFIAKIEDQEGVDNIDEILPLVDGIMIARGGLGVEAGIEKVPIIQRLLINKCNQARKMDITATQMLESMTTNIRPTRAESNDVATAVLLGSDYVMLSGESASGRYPVETVKWMTKIIMEAEKLVEDGYKEFCVKLL